MSTPHNRAENGDFAKTVLMPGDPLRAKFIAETFLEAPRLVTDVRGMYGYTGTYQGRPISVMGSGMGMPSIGIYSYELYTQYGVENIIRIGSAGSYTDKAKLFDVVLATGAYSESNYAVTQSGDTDDIQTPSAALNDETLEETRADLFGLYYLGDPKLVELGLVPSFDVAKAQYASYILNGMMTQLAGISSGRAGTSSRGSIRASAPRSWRGRRSSRRRSGRRVPPVRIRD